jgi:hypothetical protein
MQRKIYDRKLTIEFFQATMIFLSLLAYIVTIRSSIGDKGQYILGLADGILSTLWLIIIIFYIRSL